MTVSLEKTRFYEINYCPPERRKKRRGMGGRNDEEEKHKPRLEWTRLAPVKSRGGGGRALVASDSLRPNQ